MNALRVLSGVACVSVCLATGALAEHRGIQPGGSDNSTSSVPEKIQGASGAVSQGDSSTGQRDDTMAGVKEEKSVAPTQKELELNVEKTRGGGAAVAAQELNAEKSSKDMSGQGSDKVTKNKPQTGSGAQSGTSEAGRDGSKDANNSQQQKSDKTAQGRPFINEQPAVHQ